MIFIILNIALAILLFWFSSFIDVSYRKTSIISLIKMILLLAFNCLIIALNVFVGLQSETYFLSVLSKLYMIGLAAEMVLITDYVVRYPAEKKGFFSASFNIIFILGSAIIIFHGFTKVSFNSVSGVLIESNAIGGFPFTWADVYKVVYFILLPFIAIFGCVINYTKNRIRIIRQQIAIVVLAIVGGEFILLLTNLVVTSELHPLYVSLFTYSQAIMLFILYQASQTSVLRDVRDLAVYIGLFFIKYIVVTLLAGLAFAVLYVFFSDNLFVFFLLSVAFFALIVIFRSKISKIYEQRLARNQTHYESRLEKDLAGIDYTDPELNLFDNFATIVQQNVNVNKVAFLMDDNNGFLKTLYSTDNIQNKIELSNVIFKQLINENINVVLRNKVQDLHSVSPVAKELTEFMDKTSSKVLILLHEGVNVFGLILLGSKRLENVYTDYDLRTFNTLYSYFFLAGYYLKNIANEEIVGTVSREIQLSGQIITSIQENVDQIQNPKFDVGYLSKFAHNIGSEYVDFIRLSPTRHLLILGDISGKGFSASMSVVIMKSILRTFLTETTDFKELIQKMNLFIRDNLPRGTFFAGVFGLLDEENNMLYYINCGSTGLFLYNHVYNNIVDIQGKGRVLGFAKDILPLVSVKKVELSQGDMLFTCTDGFLDAKSLRNEEFGKNRFQLTVLQNMTFPANRICNFVYQELYNFTSNKLEDDVSIMVVKILGT